MRKLCIIHLRQHFIKFCRCYILLPLMLAIYLAVVFLVSGRCLCDH